MREIESKNGYKYLEHDYLFKITMLDHDKKNGENEIDKYYIAATDMEEALEMAKDLANLDGEYVIGVKEIRAVSKSYVVSKGIVPEEEQ